MQPAERDHEIYLHDITAAHEAAAIVDKIKPAQVFVQSRVEKFAECNVVTRQEERRGGEGIHRRTRIQDSSDCQRAAKCPLRSRRIVFCRDLAVTPLTSQNR